MSSRIHRDVLPSEVADVADEVRRVFLSCDGEKARAAVSDGESRVSIPKMTDRRGRRIRVPVELATWP